VKASSIDSRVSRDARASTTGSHDANHSDDAKSILVTEGFNATSFAAMMSTMMSSFAESIGERLERMIESDRATSRESIKLLRDEVKSTVDSQRTASAQRRSSLTEDLREGIMLLRTEVKSMADGQRLAADAHRESLPTGLRESVKLMREEISSGLRESITLFRTEVQSAADSQKVTAAQNRDDLTAGLREMSLQVANAVAAAAASSERSSSLNQASIKTFVDLLQSNRVIHAEATSADHPASTPTSTSDDKSPKRRSPSLEETSPKEAFPEDDPEPPKGSPHSPKPFGNGYPLHQGYAHRRGNAPSPTPGRRRKARRSSNNNRTPSRNPHARPPYGGDGGGGDDDGGGSDGDGGGGPSGGGPPGDPPNDPPNDPPPDPPDDDGGEGEEDDNDDEKNEPHGEDNPGGQEDEDHDDHRRDPSPRRRDVDPDDQHQRPTPKITINGVPSHTQFLRTSSAPTGRPTPGFDWRQLSATRHVSRGASAPTIGTPAVTDRYAGFRFRIRRGITTAVRRIIDREPSSSASNTFIKTVAAVTPIPKYGGDDDLEAFMRWLQGFITFIDIHQLVGRDNDYNRILTIGSALEGRALSWYNLNMRGPLSGPPLTFLDTIINVSDEFITPASATRAQQSFDRVKYSRSLGIRTYVRELQTLSTHIFMTIDEYTLRRQIVNAIPQIICDWLIEHKGLSTSTSTIVEWVDAIEQRERELLEQEAYHATKAIALKKATSSAERPRKAAPRDAVTGRFVSAITATTTNRFASANTAPRTVNRSTPTGPQVPSKAVVPLADIVCYACGQKGHYRGSKECPKTPSSARLHMMGVGEEVENSEDSNPEKCDPRHEDSFEGEEYEGESDVGPANKDPEPDDVGIGATIASIHVDEEADADDDFVVYMAAIASSDSKDDETVATNLMRSVKDDYESRGSGIKPRPMGKTAQQIKANSQKDWASNSNVSRNMPASITKMQRLRHGLPALVTINGVKAYTCWDSGSELDAISPDFLRALGIKPRPRESTLKIRLGTKGSKSATSYEVRQTLGFEPSKIEHPLDVVNLDRWDLILGNVFCNMYGVVLDYNTRTIRFGNTVIKAMTLEEDLEIRKRDTKVHLNVISTD
jgi:hypothetical protein